MVDLGICSSTKLNYSWFVSLWACLFKLPVFNNSGLTHSSHSSVNGKRSENVFVRWLPEACWTNRWNSNWPFLLKQFLQTSNHQTCRLLNVIKQRISIMICAISSTLRCLSSSLSVMNNHILHSNVSTDHWDQLMCFLSSRVFGCLNISR